MAPNPIFINFWAIFPPEMGSVSGKQDRNSILRFIASADGGELRLMSKKARAQVAERCAVEMKVNGGH